LLIGLSGTGLLLIFGALIVALDPPRLFGGGETGRELYQTDRNPTADGLDGLPRRYSDLPKPPIELGPPLPGDLGSAVVSVERELGLEAPQLPFRPDPEEDAARAECIRQARLAQAAREAAVFFQLTSKGAEVPGGIGDVAGQKQVSVASIYNSGLGSESPGGGVKTSKSRSLRPDLGKDQNMQGRKLDFLAQEGKSGIYNPHALQDPISPYQVMAGSIISASLVTGIKSDLPGQVIAQVTSHVYDTVSGQYLLIPQGSRLIGTYDSVIAFGQERALVIWQRIILPDGSSIEIDNLPATDTAGYAGLEDQVDFHTWRLLSGIVLSTLLGVSTELTFGTQESDLVKAIRQSTQDTVNQVGQRLTERNLNIQPTITIRPGWPLRIIVHSDLVLRPYNTGEGQ
jgi:type IV secretion system protein VirB10